MHKDQLGFYIKVGFQCIPEEPLVTGLHWGRGFVVYQK